APASSISDARRSAGIGAEPATSFAAVIVAGVGFRNWPARFCSLASPSFAVVAAPSALMPTYAMQPGGWLQTWTIAGLAPAVRSPGVDAQGGEAAGRLAADRAHGRVAAGGALALDRRPRDRRAVGRPAPPVGVGRGQERGEQKRVAGRVAAVHRDDRGGGEGD